MGPLQAYEAAIAPTKQELFSQLPTRGMVSQHLSCCPRRGAGGQRWSQVQLIDVMLSPFWRVHWRLSATCSAHHRIDGHDTMGTHLGLARHLYCRFWKWALALGPTYGGTVEPVVLTSLLRAWTPMWLCLIMLAQQQPLQALLRTSCAWWLGEQRLFHLPAAPLMLQSSPWCCARYSLRLPRCKRCVQ